LSSLLQTTLNETLAEMTTGGMAEPLAHLFGLLNDAWGRTHPVHPESLRVPSKENASQRLTDWHSPRGSFFGGFAALH